MAKLDNSVTNMAKDSSDSGVEESEMFILKSTPTRTKKSSMDERYGNFGYGEFKKGDTINLLSYSLPTALNVAFTIVKS